MGGDRAHGPFADVFERGRQSGDDRVRLRREREVDHRLGEVQLCLGHAYELDGARRRIRDDERQGVGHADVLGRQDHEPAGDEPGILAGFHHPGQPVEAGVGIRAPHALDEGGEDVVVLVVAVAQCSEGQRGFGVGERDSVAAGFDR
jgi:hypothetical protein